MEITEAGYQSIRNLIEGVSSSPWSRVIILNPAEEVILVLTTADERVSWEHTPNTNPLNLQIILRGSDIDMPIPCEVKTVIVTDETEVVYAEESLTYPFVLGRETDSLILNCKIQVPRIVGG